MLKTPEEITPQWLTEILRGADVLPRGAVEALEVGAERPFGALVAALRATYSAEAPAEAPKRLFLKLTSPDNPGRDREVSFYRALAPALPSPPVVRCFHAEYEAEARTALLLLDELDASSCSSVEREAPATEAEARRAMAALAKVHAAFWEWPSTGGAAPQEATIEAELAWYAEGLPGFIAYLGDRLSDARRALYEHAMRRFPGLWKARLLGDAPLTLIHGDAHPWNFKFPHDPAQEGAYLLDWEQWEAGIALEDVAYFITPFTYAERRARLEQPLVAHYHARLCAAGVAGYAWEQCWQDYRLCALKNLFYPLRIWLQGGWGPARWSHLEKVLVAAEDLRCAELLGAG